MRIRWMWILAGTGLLGLLLSGCIVSSSTTVRVSSGFRPATYSGHPVYFDSRIIPYCCDKAHRKRLPDHTASRYVTYYYNHKAGYHTWEANNPPSCRGGSHSGHTPKRPKGHPRPSHRRR
ncbi:MAG: hypothetical protein QGH45_01015 [Myxococcota bacterium]|nr:hypothetical protein [Myxococcota bacterium]